MSASLPTIKPGDILRGSYQCTFALFQVTAVDPELAPLNGVTGSYLGSFDKGRLVNYSRENPIMVWFKWWATEMCQDAALSRLYLYDKKKDDWNLIKDRKFRVGRKAKLQGTKVTSLQVLLLLLLPIIHCTVQLSPPLRPSCETPTSNLTTKSRRNGPF